MSDVRDAARGRSGGWQGRFCRREPVDEGSERWGGKGEDVVRFQRFLLVVVAGGAVAILRRAK